MGIVNVTPDSFSGDGLGTDVARAVAQAIKMVEDGADIVDIGGESTRPGAEPVSEAEELQRVLPVIGELAGVLPVPISIDTRKAAVADAAVQAGAAVINDIWGLQGDPGMVDVAARHQPIGVIVTHNHRGTRYADLIPEITEFFRHSMQIAWSAGVPRNQIVLDPGFGFGKTPAQNLQIIRDLRHFQTVGLPLMIGVSNKSTLGRLLDDAPVDERREASLAAATLAIDRGADIVRVHDVQSMDRVRRVVDPIVRAISEDVQALRSPGRTL